MVTPYLCGMKILYKQMFEM